VIFLVAFLPLVFHTFQYFPGFAPLQELLHAVCLFYLLYLLFKQLRRGAERKQFTSFEHYMLALIVVVPIQWGIAAWREFGQPVIYGILSERSVWDIGSVLFFSYALRKQIFTLREVKAALVFLAWGTMTLYILMRTLLHPESFTSFVGFADGAGDDAAFSLQVYFIVFGVLYYAFLGLRTGRAKNYFLALFVLTGAIGKSSGRQMIVALIVTFLFFTVRWTKGIRLLVVLPKLGIGSALLAGLLYAIFPGVVTERIVKLEEAFTVAFVGQEVDDISANARISEVLFALPGIQEHPIFGNGNVSNQWTGKADAREDYFHPSDIGVFGALYTLGVFGLIIYASQYGFAIKIARQLPRSSHTALMDASKGFLLYSGLNSVGSAMFIFDATAIMLFICVLARIVTELKAKDTRIAASMQAEAA
jgi:hypothetical protein